MLKEISLITGGAGGMGLATAKIVGRDHYVVLCDLKQEALDRAMDELERLNINSTSFTIDVSNREAVYELVEKVSNMGRIASLIHTAGVSPQMGKPDLIMKINTLGTIYLSEAFLKVATEGACLINIASMAGYFLPNFLIPKRVFKLAFTDDQTFFKKIITRVKLIPPKQRADFSYSISKNFVSWYSKKSAAAYGAKGARVLSISPGSFDTQMGRLEEKSGSEKILNLAALKRFGKPEEIAELIAFCASEKSSYTTGIDILCDGGVTAGYSLRALIGAMKK